MLICKRCKNRILVERALLSQTHLELYCICCGNRWIFEHPEKYKGFVKWLHKKEMDYYKWSIQGF